VLVDDLAIHDEPCLGMSPDWVKKPQLGDGIIAKQAIYGRGHHDEQSAWTSHLILESHVRHRVIAVRDGNSGRLRDFGIKLLNNEVGYGTIHEIIRFDRLRRQLPTEERISTLEMEK